MTFALSRRALFGLAVLSLLSLSLPGCGGGTEHPESAAPADTPETADGAAAAEISENVARSAEAPPAPPATELPPDQPSEPIKVSEAFDPTSTPGAVKGVPAATNTAPIVAIANFYADLPGIDMSSLTPAQREKFLHRANSELCTCGCKDDTLAKCYINDKSCTVVRDLLEKVLEEVRSGV